MGGDDARPGGRPRQTASASSASRLVGTLLERVRILLRRAHRFFPADGRSSEPPHSGEMEAQASPESKHGPSPRGMVRGPENESNPGGTVPGMGVGGSSVRIIINFFPGVGEQGPVEGGYLPSTSASCFNHR